MFMAGPAIATSTMSRRGLFRRSNETGTGLAQPNMNGDPDTRRKAGSAMVPIGSMWASGLRVRRPITEAVSSPSRFATAPCAHSWKTTAARNGRIHRAMIEGSKCTCWN
jgi:hypothetical protein